MTKASSLTEFAKKHNLSFSEITMFQTAERIYSEEWLEGVFRWFAYGSSDLGYINKLIGLFEKYIKGKEQSND